MATTADTSSPEVENTSSQRSSYRFTFEPYPGRVVAMLNHEIIADSHRARVMKETRLPPVYYFPRDDVRMDLARAATHRTHCPFKGNASYWSFEVGEKRVENLMWGYEDATEEAFELKDYVAFYVDQLDSMTDDEIESSSTSDPGGFANPLMAWLIRNAPEAATGRALTAQLAEAMLQANIPLSRLAVVIRTLHPQVVSFAYRWRLDSPDVEESQATYYTLETPEFQSRSLLPIFEGAGGIRRRLDGSDPILDFPILADLKKLGATDYVAMPMTFTDGKINAITLASDRPGGFSTTDLGFTYEILSNLARLYEVHATKRTATTLLETYLGPHAGARVMRGAIQQGDGENINAVIWFCDLRDSTPLAASLTREQFLGALNQFFDCMAGAVHEHGGQVLRFIGDAALAIFPVADAEAGDANAMSAETARKNALHAVLTASQRIEETNRKRKAKGWRALRYGIALHIGEVTYGNIGTKDRLEFTVIGDAANRAARIESMCKELGEPILLSGEIASHFPDRTVSLGHHELRGVDEPVELFTLREK